MKTLLKKHGFSCNAQYFELIIESYINGNISQCEEQIKALKKNERKEALIYSVDNYGINAKFSRFILNSI